MPNRGGSSAGPTLARSPGFRMLRKTIIRWPYDCGRKEIIRVSLTQDNNETEEARAHSEGTWKMMPGGLKVLLEDLPRDPR